MSETNKMKIHGWSGKWPTDEYPPNGTLVRYKHHRSGRIKEAKIEMCWCGPEPVFNLDNGDSICVCFDPYEVINEAASS